MKKKMTKGEKQVQTYKKFVRENFGPRSPEMQKKLIDALKQIG